MAVKYISPSNKEQSGYIVSGKEIKKLEKMLFDTSPTNLQDSIKKDIDRLRKINARKK